MTVPNKQHEESSNKPGIYGIKDTRTKGYLSIGSAKSLSRRKNDLLYELRRGLNQNKGLQDFFSEYGESSIEFEVLEYCEENELETKKKTWEEKLQPSLSRKKRIEVDLTGDEDTQETILELLHHEWMSDAEKERVKVFYTKKYPQAPPWPSYPIRAWVDPSTGRGDLTSTSSLEGRREWLRGQIEVLTSIVAKDTSFSDKLSSFREQLSILDEYLR